MHRTVDGGHHRETQTPSRKPADEIRAESVGVEHIGVPLPHMTAQPPHRRQGISAPHLQDGDGDTLRPGISGNRTLQETYDLSLNARLDQSAGKQEQMTARSPCFRPADDVDDPQSSTFP
ncbi:MAG: hypothetical protein Kow00129_00520 [Thermoleophilia bacterium]